MIAASAARPLTVIALLLLFLPAMCWGRSKKSPGAIAPAPGYEPLVENLRAFIQSQVEAKDLPAISVALVDGDKIVWAEGFGFRDAEKKKPATAASIYRVGSVSKLFTDVAMMQLVEQGKLDLDAPVSKYLPDFKPENPYEETITLRRLASHRSGLVRESPVGNYFDPDEPTQAASVESLNGTKLVYQPNTRTKYSNAGLAVIGQVVEKTSGKSFDDQLAESVFKTLGMANSSYALEDRLREDLATGWMRTYDGRRFESPQFRLGTVGAGNLYSSVLDLSKFMLAVFADGKAENGQLLKPETIQAMLEPQSAPKPGERFFGIGFNLLELDGRRTAGHGGAVYGYSTQCATLPEEKLGVAVVVSFDGARAVTQRVRDHALRLLSARRANKPLPLIEPTGPIPVERAKQLVGRYVDDSGAAIDVDYREGRLMLPVDDFRVEVRSLGDKLVVDDLLDYGVEVRREGADGLVIGDKHYRRVEDARPEPCPQRYRGLVGEYGWDHNTLYIYEDHGQLCALIEWFHDYRLDEINENEFAFPDMGLYPCEKLIFKRDASGMATEVVAADVRFVRREIGVRHGETFQIKPIRPIEEIRVEALAAKPPEESGDFRSADLVELVDLDPSILLDIRYASTNNFTGAVFYKQPKAFMQRPAAEAVVRVHRQLKQLGYGLMIHDAYRPWFVTKMFWEATPGEMRDFVANPANGSRHNRGCAVDLTLYDLKTKEPIEMVAGYDEFSFRSYPNYPGGTSLSRWHRRLLRRAMEAEDFSIYEYEWWHFDFHDWKKYRIGNKTFEQLDAEE